jgi:hypothetical protein
LEESLWRMFWEEHGLHPDSVLYLKGLGLQLQEDLDLKIESKLEGALDKPHISVAAFIVNTIDGLIHTSLLGQRDFYHRVKYWAGNTRYLQTLVSRLLDQFETVILTSDHGHVLGTGIGDLSLSSIAEERALRTRIFSGIASDKLIGELTDVVSWQNTGLPQYATVIIPKGRGLFAKEGYQGISHGGASIEETIVPYISIKR